MTHYKVFYRYIHRLRVHICVEKYRYLNELLPINRRYDCISIPKISNSKEKLKRSGKKRKMEININHFVYVVKMSKIGEFLVHKSINLLR